jgi:hypothetical protein
VEQKHSSSKEEKSSQWNITIHLLACLERMQQANIFRASCFDETVVDFMAPDANSLTG